MTMNVITTIRSNRTNLLRISSPPPRRRADTSDLFLKLIAVIPNKEPNHFHIRNSRNPLIICSRGVIQRIFPTDFG